MYNEEIAEILENLTEEQAQEILAEEFDEELEKQAAAEVAQSEFENALYAYGAFSADLEIDAAAAGDDGLSKEASEEYAAIEAEIAQAIEEGVEELGLDVLDSDLELHKTAMAAAAIIFEGYSDQMEKVAKAKGAGVMKTISKYLAKGKKKAGEGIAAGKKHLKKHKAKYMAGAGGMALGYGASKAHESMNKKASELTAEELIDMTLEKQATVDLVAEGLYMLEKRAAKKATFMKTVKGIWNKGKKQVQKGYGYAKKKVGEGVEHVKKNKGAYMAGAGGVGTGVLAHKYMSKKEK